MAASSPKPPVSLKNLGETWHSRSTTSEQFLSYGTRVRTGRFSCDCVSRLQRRRMAEFLVKSGCWCDQASSPYDYGVTEEDKEFVKVLWEAQPYVAVHRDSVFVVVISAEIVASPYLDPILKVLHFPSLLHKLFNGNDI
ncbi:putative amino-acid N-acetyltransferase [Lupinus albus]|uniref:Putative amino-acid N-acetyltransferase n=1 Tax=Lupinus albus TaxID=3870 RepID=A0A6A4PC73_LUPAL|nr:putative amino-acid N-acetyltransferase [Lupinus albus]